MAKALAKGSRITGTQRQQLASQFGKRYSAGDSIRKIADDAGRSFGFVHGVLVESGVALRSRGGATRGAKKAAPARKATAKKTGTSATKSTAKKTVKATPAAKKTTTKAAAKKAPAAAKKTPAKAPTKTTAKKAPAKAVTSTTAKKTATKKSPAAKRATKKS